MTLRLDETLAREVGRRFNDVTPWHVRVRTWVEPNRFCLKQRSFKWLASEEIRLGFEDPVEDLESTLADALEEVQRFMTGHGIRGWPGTRQVKRGADAGYYFGHARRPMPGAAVEFGRLRLFYGDKHLPELELEPIFL